MTAPALSTPALTVAAAQLLNAARASGSSRFCADDLDSLLHRGLRYDQRGPRSRAVTPLEAFGELARQQLVGGTPDDWFLQ